MSQASSQRTASSQQSPSRPWVKNATWDTATGQLKCNAHGRILQLKHVGKAGPNNGRPFYSSTSACEQQGCKVFHWADGQQGSAPSTPARSQMSQSSQPAQRLAPDSQATAADDSGDEFDKINDTQIVQPSYHASPSAPRAPSSPAKRGKDMMAEDDIQDFPLANDAADDVFGTPPPKRTKTTFGNLSTPTSTTANAFKAYQEQQRTPASTPASSPSKPTPASSPNKETLVQAFAPLEELLSNHIASTVAAFKLQLERSDRLRLAAEKKGEHQNRITTGLKDRVRELEGQKRFAVCSF